MGNSEIESASSLIARLASTVENCQKLADAGYIELLTSALAATSPGTCEVLVQIASASRDLQERIKAAGAVERLTAILADENLMCKTRSQRKGCSSFSPTENARMRSSTSQTPHPRKGILHAMLPAAKEHLAAEEHPRSKKRTTRRRRCTIGSIASHLAAPAGDQRASAGGRASLVITKSSE